VELYYDGSLNWQILAGGHLVTEEKGSETDFFLLEAFTSWLWSLARLNLILASCRVFQSFSSAFVQTVTVLQSSGSKVQSLSKHFPEVTW